MLSIEEKKEKEKIRYKRYCEKNKEKVKETDRIYYIKKGRNNHFKRKYNLEPYEYDKLLKSQNNKCLICEIDLIKPYLDHEHNTNRIRGFLCYHCNVGLGHFRDSIELLENAIKYLHKA